MYARAIQQRWGAACSNRNQQGVSCIYRSLPGQARPRINERFLVDLWIHSVLWRKPCPNDALVILSGGDRLQLSAVVRSRSLPHGLVMQTRVVLLEAIGLSRAPNAEKLGVSQQTVCLWRKRYIYGGVQGLHDEMKPRRP